MSEKKDLELELLKKEVQDMKNIHIRLIQLLKN